MRGAKRGQHYAEPQVLRERNMARSVHGVRAMVTTEDLWILAMVLIIVLGAGRSS